jgi:hypothetical protein
LELAATGIATTSTEHKIEIGDMRVTPLVNMRRSKVKSKFINRAKTYKRLLQETGNNVVFETIKRHWLMMSELEADTVLVCRDALRYFLVAVIVLCLCAS